MATMLDGKHYGKGYEKEASNEPQPCAKSIRNTQEYMEEIQKYPVLYDKFSKDFKDKYKKQNAWSAIATTFGVTPEEAEKRYKSIRTSFGRYLKKKKTLPTGTGRKDVPYIAEYENLDWLKSFIEHRDTITNINIPDDSLHVDVNSITDDSIVADDETSVSSEVDCTSSDGGLGSGKDRKGSTNTRKRPWSKCAEKVTKQQLDEALFKGINNISKALSTSVDAISTDEGDEDTLFCKSIVPQLKRLQPPMKQQAKIQIQQILFNCEFQHPWQAQPACTSPTMFNK